MESAKVDGYQKYMAVQYLDGRSYRRTGKGWSVGTVYGTRPNRLFSTLSSYPDMAILPLSLSCRLLPAETLCSLGSR